MNESWAIPGLDLHVEIDRNRTASSLEAALRAAVREGRLATGTRLPSSRTLAADLGIARNSVADVFAQLSAEGWLEARVGAGTWVRSQTAAGTPDHTTAAPVSARRLDLRGGIPDASAFPRRVWAAAARRAVVDASSADFGYAPDFGAPGLRATLAEYVARARGVVATAEHVVVTRGFGDLLWLACRSLAATGARRVVVEEVGHAAHREIIRAAGLEPVPIRVDHDGADLDTLDDSVDAVLLTPAHQFPTGALLAPDRRMAAVRWAERTGGLIMDDDYDGEFRYDRRPIGALQALAPEHVLYAGTASKSLAPAVGLAWGVVPDRLLDSFTAERRRTGATVDALNQRTLEVVIATHEYDRNVRRLRGRYRARRREVESRVTDELPECRVTGLDAGLHFLLELPEGTSETRVSEHAARLGLRFIGLKTFRSAGTPWRHPPAMVVGYGAPPAHRFNEAIDLAIRAVRDVLDDHEY
ncbi:MAG: PLP-dependent aminotransferase family protein [Actinomycetota bacterium]|nr:PLP-dependent aminotransferase family protein [Actinomycetota bacterium]